MTIALHPALVAMRDVRAGRIASFRSGALDGIALHRTLSAAMDAAIREVWRELELPERGVALVALGGYGRGLLAPGSDVDLMILHDSVPVAAQAGQPLFYALWDAGIKVGHAVRTPKESLALAGENLEAETSFLDARLLDGDAALFERFAAAAREATQRRCDEFVTDVREMMRLRHRAHGSATSQLEPNIKEGTGGLRDLHVLDWFTSAVGDLFGLGLLDDRDRAELDDAHRFLLATRAHLHLEAGGLNDALMFHSQRPVALALGYRDAEMIAEDAFMRDLFAATRAVELTVTSVAAELSCRNVKPKRKAPRAGCFVVAGERVLIDGDFDVERCPEDAIALFSLGVPPGAVAMRSVRRALEGKTLPMTPAVRQAFVELLRSAPGPLLEMADHAGVFAALFPAWESVRLQPQRNVYHRYTVDAHLFHTAEAMASLLRGSDDPLTRAVVKDVARADEELLLLAALFHDVGKGTDEEHCARGERIVRGLSERLGLEPERMEDLAWLVREHLILVDVATRRDLSDDTLVAGVASRLSTVRRARLLFLLTRADGIGTGPAAWTPWKADLVAELFTRVVHVLERGELAPADLAAAARARADEALSVAGPDAVLVAHHLAGMDRTYVLRFDARELVEHARLAEGLEPGAVRTVARPGEDATSEVTVIAHDAPGIFRKASGVLALHNLSILTAEVHTRGDGIALESFRCVGPRGLPVEPERFERVHADLERAFAGRLALDARLAEKRENVTRISKGKQEPPKVLTDNAVSDVMTVVEVHATDRLGLLHDLTAALGECGLDVHRAKIATYGDDVVDVFYVRDLAGDKILDAGHLAEIERAILHRLRSAEGPRA